MRQGGGSERNGGGPSGSGPRARGALIEIEEYWRALKVASGYVPRRSDVDANHFAGALPYAFVLERAAPGVARFRLAGQTIADLLGGEAKGLPLSVMFAPGSRPPLQGWLDRCFDGPALVELLLELPQGALRQPIRGRLLLLPLLDQADHATRVLGGLLLNGAPRRREVLFELADAVPRVETISGHDPKRVFAQLEETIAQPGLREAERPYLRLVVSNYD